MATDLSFRAGYWLGEKVIFSEGFKKAFGEELYEMVC